MVLSSEVITLSHVIFSNKKESSSSFLLSFDYPFERFKKLGYPIPKRKKSYSINGIEVNNRKRFITTKNNITQVIAYDTETYKGKVRLLARSDSNYIYSNELSFDDCLDFLFYKAKESKNTWFFFFNLDFDITSILKTWNNIESISKLIRGIPVKYKKYTLTWLKSRMFIIRKGTRIIRFTDINNLFKMSLQKASETYLKVDGKDNIDGDKLNNESTYWNKNLKAIIKYCIKDCELTRDLGKLLLDKIIESEVEIPKYLCSPASLSKQDFRFHSHIPNISCVPIEIQKIAHDCYFGGRFEMLKRGFFNKVYLYDINSQYPHFIKELPSLKFGLWKPIDYIPDNQCIGYFHVKMIIPDDNYISTIPIKNKNRIKFPNGYIEKWLTWFDIDLLREYVIKVNEGFVYVEAPCEYKPFKERILHHYKQKTLYKDNNKVMYDIHKLTMNALYGCFMEIHENELDDGIIEFNAGCLFNSVYASQITAFGRWSVLKDVWTERKYIIAIHTDSIITNKKMNLDIGTEIGQWTLETSGKGYILNTGMYQINGKKKLIKTRGIPLLKIKDWFKFAKKYGNLESKRFIIKRMLKISQSLIQYKNIDDVNTMMENERTVSVNSDRKRNWNNDFVDFNDSLTRNIDSLPYIVNLDINSLEIYPNPSIYQY